MKRRLSIALSILYLISLSGCVEPTERESGSYLNNYYAVSQPVGWNYEAVEDYCAIVYKNENKIGTITVYPDTEYADSVSSIVANLFGMHAYLKEKMISQSGIANLEYCLVVGYEASAAQQEKNELSQADELHYIYINESDTMIDFCVELSYATDDVKKVMESIEFTSGNI